MESKKNIRVGSKKSFRSNFKNGYWNDIDIDFDQMDKELGVVRRMGAMGRKRVEPSPCTSPFRTPLKRQCSIKLNSEKSTLEALPQDILVRIVCGVDHEDLGQLLCVSKSIKDATLIAKEWHFAYRTPSSRSRSYSDIEDDSNPSVLNAPRPGKGRRSFMKGRNLADISVALFRSPEDD